MLLCSVAAFIASYCWKFSFNLLSAMTDILRALFCCHKNFISKTIIWILEHFSFAIDIHFYVTTFLFKTKMCHSIIKYHFKHKWSPLCCLKVTNINSMLNSYLSLRTHVYEFPFKQLIHFCNCHNCCYPKRGSAYMNVIFICKFYEGEKETCSSVLFRFGWIESKNLCI